MSSPWLKPLDVDRLSEAEADVDFVIPLAELPRLRAQLASVAGEVHGRVHFRRAAGIPVAELTVNGTARLVCQRCLEAMEVGIEAATEVGLLLTLPIVPLHAEDAACDLAPEAPLADDGREEETQKPFEQLAELLKRQ